MWQEYLSNTTTGSLFQNYAWCREYYLDLQKNNTSLAENWTQKAFNPFVSYNLPPMIVQYNVDIHAEGTSAAKISFWYLVRDVQGIAEIKLELVELCTNTVKWEYKIDLVHQLPTEYNCSGWVVIGTSTLFFGCELRIRVSNGFNTVSATRKFDGFCSMCVDAITALAEMLLGGLQKAWEAVANAVNVIVEWIKGIIDQLMQPLYTAVDMIKARYGEFIKGMVSVFTGGQTKGEGEVNTAKLMELIFGVFVLILPLALVMMALVIGISAILGVYIPIGALLLFIVVTAYTVALYQSMAYEDGKSLIEAGKALGYTVDNVRDWLEGIDTAYGKGIFIFTILYCTIGKVVSVLPGEFSVVSFFLGLVFGWIGLFASAFAAGDPAMSQNQKAVLGVILVAVTAYSLVEVGKALASVVLAQVPPMLKIVGVLLLAILEACVLGAFLGALGYLSKQLPR
jgi:hypothetical protein